MLFGKRQFAWRLLPLFLALWPASTAAVAKMITSRLLLAISLRGRGERRGGHYGLLQRLRNRTGGAAGNERWKRSCRIFDRTSVDPGLRLVPKIPRLLLATLRTLIEGPTVLSVAIVELAVLPWAAILLLRARLIPRLPFSVRLRTAIVRGRIWLRALLGIERRLGGSLLRRRKTIRDSAEVVVIIALVRLLSVVLRTQEALLSLLLSQLRGGNQPEIVFRVLEIAFSHDRIAR